MVVFSREGREHGIVYQVVRPWAHPLIDLLTALTLKSPLLELLLAICTKPLREHLVFVTCRVQVGLIFGLMSQPSHYPAPSALNFRISLQALPTLSLYPGGRGSAGPHHEEGVPNPQTAPAQGALWDGDVLAVHSNGLRGCLTHRAAADVLGDLCLADGHHRDGGGGGEPVGLIIPSGIVAHFVDVAVDEWHGAEAGQAGASKPWKERR